MKSIYILIKDRLSKAHQYIVTEPEVDVFHVESNINSNKKYTVYWRELKHFSCHCRDSFNHKIAGYCKHVYAVLIYLRNKKMNETS